jgi:phosphonate transport system substrate-binding protein
MEILLSPRDRPVADSIGYLFARSELNLSTWVHKRLVDAGAMSNLDWRSPQRIPDLYRRDMMVFHETPEYPRALEMVRGDMAPEVKARLREVLIEAASDGDYDLGGLILDRLFGFEYPDPEFAFKLHRLT